jgi:hypothetical protein
MVDPALFLPDGRVAARRPAALEDAAAAARGCVDDLLADA